MIRLILIFAFASTAAMAETPANHSSPAEQALGQELIECVRAKVGLRAEVIGLQAVAKSPPAPETPAPHE
jgi:hypothetical protein